VVSIIANTETQEENPAGNLRPMSQRNAVIAVLLVLFATVVWGSQYVLIKQGLTAIPLFLFQGIRHLIAFLGFCPWWGRFRKMNKEIFVAALLNSVAFYFLIMFVSAGLQFTLSNEGAFMATMYVVFTPFVAYAVLKDKIKKMHLAGIAVAVAGMAIMLFGNAAGSLAFNIVGDLLVLIGAFFNAIQIVLLEKYTKKIDTMLFVLTQMLMIALMMLGTSAAIQERVDWAAIPPAVWINWVYLGIAAGTITLLIQAWAQRMIDATRAALLYSLEPVFGAFFSAYLGAEPFTIAFFIGASLIMGGILLSSVKLTAKRTLGLPFPE
jgi:drug/metabolite transporter (DMT)-like permease